MLSDEMKNIKEKRNTMPGEIWADIPFTNGDYSVSSFGRVYSNRYLRFLRIYINRFGYQYTSIYSKNYFVHRLVAYAFLGFEPLGRGELEINHIDGDKKNNSLSNLEIVTHRENIRHALATGLKPFGMEGVRAVKDIGSVSKRLRHYVIDVLKICPSDFIEKTGTHHSILNGRMNYIKDKTLKKITSVYPLNPDWVRYGTGNMLVK